MSSIKRFMKGLKSFRQEFAKTESEIKGEEFEEYVREYMFPKENYVLLHKTHSFRDNAADFVESSLLPDFLFRDKKTQQLFYVECKFRNGKLNHQDKVEWCNSSQLARYKRVNVEEYPVFIALGFGEIGSNSETLCLFSVSQGQWVGLYPSFLDKYLFYLKKPVYSSYLWKLI